MSGIYSLYGLKIKSGVPLPCPRLPAGMDCDLEFVREPGTALPPAPALKKSDWFYHRRLTDGSHDLSWNKVARFLISPDHRTVRWSSRQKNPDEGFRNYFLNQILSFKLVHSGIEPLHGIAVKINGGAVIFLGDCAYGKSTLGAWFVSQNFKLITDDLIVITGGKNRPFMILPGLPRLKLFPRPARTILGHDRGLRMLPRSQKLIFPLQRRQFCPRPLPVKAIYCLPSPLDAATARRITITPLAPKDAFMELVKNTFNSVLFEPERLKNELDFCASTVAGRVPLRQLCYPRGLKKIGDAGFAIIEDVSRLK